MNFRSIYVSMICYILVSMTVLFCRHLVYGGQKTLVVGNFSEITNSDELPKGWEPLYFKNINLHTTYEPVKDGDTVVIKAQSKSSSSGLIRKIQLDPKDYPIISWRWKISNIYDKGDVRTKEGDDYPARVYITFAYDPEKVGIFERVKFNAARLFYGDYPPSAALNYIWANIAEKGTVVPNAYTDRAMMIVVQSGEFKTNKWIYNERNILDDYVNAFGTNPPQISGVAIMTDSDNTHESATTYYGDIVFKTAENPLTQ